MRISGILSNLNFRNLFENLENIKHDVRFTSLSLSSNGWRFDMKSQVSSLIGIELISIQKYNTFQIVYITITNRHFIYHLPIIEITQIYEIRTVTLVANCF